MKLKKLLVLSALFAFAANGAKAGVPEGVWTMPEPQGLEFTTFTDDGEHYYLYNTAAKMFFSAGNNWGTQASVRTFGIQVWLEPATEEDAPDGSYELWDENINPERSTGSGNVFTDDGNSSWVDHGSQGNYSWAYELVGDCVRFQNVAFIADKPAYEGMYLGFTGTFNLTEISGTGSNNLDAYTSVLRHVSPTAEGAGVDWKAVTVDSYEAFIADEAAFAAYENGAKAYIASCVLKETIEKAEALYIDVTAALAVYTNTASTADQLAQAANDLTPLINAKQKLKDAIEDYESKGYTATAEARAVLTNPQATLAEVEQALTDLENAYVEWASNQASVQNPIDLTAKIVNPTFDNADCTTGWSGTAFGRGGTVSDGAEHYSKTFDTYQTIKGLTPGIYAVGVNGYYRSGNYNSGTGPAITNWLANNEASRFTKLYAKAGEDAVENQVPVVNVMIGGQAEAQGVGDVEVTYEDENGETVTVYVPNTMAAADHFFHNLHLYANKLYVAVGEAGELTIGVKKSSLIDGDWSMFDDFSLTFYGEAADACNLYLSEALKNFSDYTPEEGTLYTEAYLTAYREAIAGEKTANNLQEVNAIMSAIDQSYNDLMKNIELWKDYQALLVKGTTMAVNPEYDGIEELYDMMDYIDMESSEILDALELTNEELEAAIAQLNEWIDTIIEKSKLDVWEGKKMTSYIKNPGFDEDKDINSGAAEGWTIDRISGGNVVRGPLGQGNQDIMVSALGEQNFCFESWHCHKWDVWQEITGLPVGMYELQVQGYVRCEVGGYTQGDPIEPDFPSPVYLYMNAAQTSFPSVYDEAIDPSHFLEDGSLPVVEGHSWTGAVENYPNSMGAASLCFKWGMYKKQAYGLIARDGDTFRIGVKMDADQDWWCIWDNFQLIYHEPTAELVKPILEEELAKLDLNLPMGKDVYERAVAVKAAADEAIASEDGKKMFEALSDLYELSEAINTSVALFTRLEKAVEGLQESIYDSDNEAAITEAKTLIITILDGIDSHSFTDAEAEALFEKIEAARTKLLLPANVMEATDENPVEVTAIIQTPSFEKDGTNSIDGWVATGQKFGNSDQLSALALESWESVFHIYQDIVGLPDGTYTLTVNAWERTASPTYLYGESGGQTFGKELITQADGLPEGYEAPSSLTAAVDMFDEYTYVNEIVVKVVDNKLRIGIRKDETASADWIVMDNFRLFYHGANSSLEPTGDPSSINETAGTLRFTVEYFTLDGRKATGLEKGILIQKMTLENGTVMMKKITK